MSRTSLQCSRDFEVCSHPKSVSFTDTIRSKSQCSAECFLYSAEDIANMRMPNSDGGDNTLAYAKIVP